MSGSGTGQADGVEEPVGRRRMLRGGAVIAGIAGAAALGTTAPRPAAAADGDSVLAGRSTASSSTTALTSSSRTPALRLTSTAGAQLELVPNDNPQAPDLAVGQIQNTSSGLYIGVHDGNTTGTSRVATLNDIYEISPVPSGGGPFRVLDTRDSATRTRVIRTSTSKPYDADGRLRAGAWLDVAVDQLDVDGEAFDVTGVFLNLTVTGAVSHGWVLAYLPDLIRPSPASTVNFATGQTISNSAFVTPRLVGNDYLVRFYAEATTHVIIDLYGAFTQVFVPGRRGLPFAGAPALSPADQVRQHRAQRRTYAPHLPPLGE